MLDNKYLNMQLEIPIYGFGPGFSNMTKCLKDNDRLPIGKDHNNPIFDTRIYEVEYKDGHKALL